MNIVDLLVTIVVVTILVTIILAVITYIAYKLRLSREPLRSNDIDGPQYFISYLPPTAGLEKPTEGSPSDGASEEVAGLEEHATEA